MMNKESIRKCKEKGVCGTKKDTSIIFRVLLQCGVTPTIKDRIFFHFSVPYTIVPNYLGSFRGERGNKRIILGPNCRSFQNWGSLRGMYMMYVEIQFWRSLKPLHLFLAALKQMSSAAE